MSIRRFVTRVFGEKAEWRQYKARVKQLPEPYRAAVGTFERYLMHFGGVGEGIGILKDLIDLFEQSAANRVPIRQVVGEDPVEFIEAFVRNYPEDHWIHRERERLTNAINDATEKEARGV